MYPDKLSAVNDLLSDCAGGFAADRDVVVIAALNDRIVWDDTTFLVLKLVDLIEKESVGTTDLFSRETIIMADNIILILLEVHEQAAGVVCVVRYLFLSFFLFEFSFLPNLSSTSKSISRNIFRPFLPFFLSVYCLLLLLSPI